VLLIALCELEIYLLSGLLELLTMAALYILFRFGSLLEIESDLQFFADQRDAQIPVV
jgi:hypothetical protein